MHSARFQRFDRPRADVFSPILCGGVRFGTTPGRSFTLYGAGAGAVSSHCVSRDFDREASQAEPGARLHSPRARWLGVQLLPVVRGVDEALGGDELRFREGVEIRSGVRTKHDQVAPLDHGERARFVVDSETEGHVVRRHVDRLRLRSQRTRFAPAQPLSRCATPVIRSLRIRGCNQGAEVVAQGGFEPPTPRFSVACSTN